MAADIVAYSRMVEADESGALARVRSFFDGRARPAVEAAGGRVVKTMGDGFLAAFPSARAAVAAAIEVQNGLEAAEADAPIEQRLALRVGISFGEVTVEEGEVLGEEVNLAARLEGMADAGGVLVSQAVIDELPADLRAGFHDNGPRKFHNISHAAPVWSWPRRLSRAEAGKPRVHLAAFSGDAGRDAEAAGDLTDELGAHLAPLTGIEVAAEPRAADYLVEGGVRVRGGRARVHARIVARADARQIWSGRWTENTDDPFEISDRAAPRLANAIRREVVTDDGRRIADRPLDELSFDQLLARAALESYVPEVGAWRRAAAIARQALLLRPNDFMALGMTATAVAAERFYACTPLPPDDIPGALAQISEALRRASRSDMAHAVHASLLVIDGRPAEALVAADQAIEINPDYNVGWASRAAALVALERAGEAVDAGERALSLYPGDPYAHFFARIAGYAHLVADAPEEAARLLERADGLAPGLGPQLAPLAAVRLRTGDAEGARGAALRLLEAVPGFRASALWLYALPPRACAAIAEDLVAAGAPR